jgi:16S rRNA (cytosine967-C5)-methyltransferase
MWLLLRLGVCQLLCLNHIPAHAAVHETVALCDWLRKPRAKGFINGTLRNLERDIEMPMGSEALPVSPTLSGLDTHTLPLLEFSGWERCYRRVRLRRPVFADPRSFPRAYVSEVCSLPFWLLQRWTSLYPESDELLGAGLWFTTPGRMSLRVNLQKSTREAVMDVLSAAGVSARPGVFPESILLASTLNVVDLPGFREGWFSVQDESAMAITELIAPQPGERILDLCSAPGGKTCHMAERLKGAGMILACDVDPARLRSVEQNAERLGLTSTIQARSIPADGSENPGELFDAVLVDVPCSNTGVLGKRQEARWRLTPASFEKLLPLQQRLLMAALKAVKPGGRVVYSTCSIDPAENAEVVAAVLSRSEGIRLECEQFSRPGAPADGGYRARMRREH